MKDSGWRQAWALARLEAGAALSSPRRWVLRYSIAGLFSLVILGTLLAKTGFGSPQPPLQIEELGIFLARLLGFCAYVAAGFWGLFAPSWAMEGAQQSGMLDLLRTSPLSHKQILFSIVGGNLLALGQGFVPVLPLFLLPFYFGGISVIGTLLFAAISTLLGSILSISISLFGFVSSQRGAKEVQTGENPFITGGLVFLFLGFKEAIWSEPGDYAPWMFGAGAVAILVARYCLRGALRGFSQRAELFGRSSPRESRPFKRREGHWKNVLRALGRIVGKEEEQEGQDETDDSRELLSVSRKRLLGRGEVEQAVYRLTRHSPFVLLWIVGRTKDNAAASIGVVVFLLAVFLYRPLGPLICMLLICQETAGLLPSAAQRGLVESLLASPLTGWDIAMGGLAIAFLRTVLPVGAVLIVIFLPMEPEFSLAGSAASFLLFCGTLLLAYGISLWTLPLLKRPGARTAASFALILALALAWLTFIPASSMRSAQRAVLLGAGVTALAGVVLVVAFAFGFRKLMR